MTKSKEYSQKSIQIARYAKALGHPARVAILQLLESCACCYSGNMAEDLPIARSTLSQHLKELKHAGLIQGEFSPPRIKYCINRDNWDEAKKLFNNFWNEENDNLNS